VLPSRPIRFRPPAETKLAGATTTPERGARTTREAIDEGAALGAVPPPVSGGREAADDGGVTAMLAFGLASLELPPGLAVGDGVLHAARAKAISREAARGFWGRKGRLLVA
jgi:hypothetical protein